MAILSDIDEPGILIPNIFSYWAASSLPLYIRNLPSGIRPLITHPISFVILYVLLSVPLSIILLITIFSVPVTMPSEHTTPQMVLKERSVRDVIWEDEEGLTNFYLPWSFNSLFSIFNLEILSFWWKESAFIIKLNKSCDQIMSRPFKTSNGGGSLRPNLHT